MWLFSVVAVVFVLGAWWFFRWLRKWKDPTWDTREGQSKAFLWSKRGTGGRGY